MAKSPQKAGPPHGGPALWLLFMAIGVGVALVGVIVDIPTAARAALIVSGGVILGSLIGWSIGERLRARPAPAEAEAEAGPREYFPAPSIWPFVVTLGIAITVPGLIANLSAGQQAALVAVGATIGGIGLIGWVVQDLLSLSPRFALATAAPMGPTRPYTPVTTAVRSEARQTLYHRALQDIVSSRFAFPTPKYPDYAVRVNDPHRSLGVQMPDGAVAYPDIVVVHHPENRTKIVAQVETSESVGETAARYEWLPYALLAPLYLYVPVGQGDEALALCRRFSVPVVGIRTWRYVVGYEGIEINDHFTVPAGPEDLLPKILRPSSS